MSAPIMTVDVPPEREKRVTTEAFITKLQQDMTQVQKRVQDLNEKVARMFFFCYICCS